MIRSLLLSLAMIAVMVLSSCSQSNDLFEFVPADADYVATADCDRLLSDLGIELTDTDLKGPESLNTLLKDIPAENRANLVKLSKTVDIKGIVAFGYAGSEGYALARITDKAALQDFFKQSSAEKQTSGDYEIYCENRSSMAIDGDMLWMIPQGDAAGVAALLDKLKTAAKKSNITADDDLMDALTADNAINFTGRLTNDMMACLTGGNDLQTTLALSTLVPSINSYRVEAGLNVAESTIAINARIVNPENGETLSIPLLKKIDQSILGYIPADCTVALAAGLNNEQFTGLTATVKDFATADPSIAKALEMLGNIDGTVGLACNTKSFDNMGIGATNGGKAIAFAQTKQGKAVEMSNYIVSMLKFTPGVLSSTNGPVTMVTRPNADPIYVTAENDLLFISSEPVAKASNPLTAPMKDAQLAYAVNIASLSDMTSGKIKFGVKGYATFSDGKINACLETTGSDLISALVSLTSASRPDTDSESYWDEPDADRKLQP